MEKEQWKATAAIISLLSGIAIAILNTIVEPDNITVDTILDVAYVLMITVSLFCTFTIKTDEPVKKKEDTVIDEKYVKQFNEARDLKWIANSLFISCAIEAVIMQWCEIGSKWWWLLQGTFILNFILAFLLRMTSSQIKADLKKQMEEDKNTKALIDLLSNMTITITFHEDDKDNEYPKSM